MHKLFSTAKINLLSKLSVPMARNYFQRTVCDNTLHEVVSGEKQLLIDVSVIIKNDGRTGIQRVVRSLLLQLHRQCPDGWRVRPVFRPLHGD